MTGTNLRTSCRNLFRKLEILSLPSQFIYSMMKFLSSNLDQFIFNSTVHTINTRLRLKLHKPTGFPRRNVQYFGRVFLMLKYTDITQNTYIQSWTVTEIMAIEKRGLLGCPRTVRLQLYRINLESSMQPPLPIVIWLREERTLASFTAHELHPTR